MSNQDTMSAGDLSACFLCGRGVMADGVPTFWRIALARMGVDRGAVGRVAGLEMMLGSVQLARVMGGDEPLARPLLHRASLLVCETCAAHATTVYHLGLGDPAPDTRR